MSTEDKELGKGLRTCPESNQNPALLKKKKKRVVDLKNRANALEVS